MNTLEIIGRRSSLFTRMALIVAEEFELQYRLEPIYDMTALGPEAYASNPALKLPILRRGDSVLLGTLNICRALAEEALATDSVVWPESRHDDVSRNAQELVWHCMTTQVQLLVGTLIGKLPADNIFFRKASVGLEGSLAWLDRNLAVVLERLPRARKISIFEISLFCLIEHLSWRSSMQMDRYPALTEFARHYALRESSQRTAYAFDTPSVPTA